MRSQTAGHTAFFAWVAEAEKVRTRVWVAEKLRVQPSTVTQWVTLYAVPDTVSQLVLEELAGIAPRLWLTRTELKRLSSCLAAIRKHAA
jgi:hypothetical protein